MITRITSILKTLILLFIICPNINSQGEWYRVESPVNTTLSSLFLLDSLNVWAAGNSGTIIYSSDGGDNWSIQNSGISYPYNIVEIHFSDSINGWCVSINVFEPPFGTILLKTTDGGVNWQSFPYPEELTFFHTIYFFNPSYGFTAGNDGLILRTTDGGENWRQAPVDSGFYKDLTIIDIKFRDSLNGYASGGNIDVAGVIWRSTDGGENWWSLPCGSPEPINEIYFRDSVNIIGIGGDFEWGTGIVTSSDDGDTWDYKSMDIFGVGSSIAFRTPGDVWGSLRTNNSLVYSSDSGSTWIPVVLSDTSYIFDLEFSDSLHGIACGYGGEILKWRKTLVGLTDDLHNPFSDFHLYSNYPNPFNPSTKIGYTLPHPGEVKIVVYDILGNKLLIKNEYRRSGFNESVIDMDNYTSGVYFYSVFFNESVKSGKMILLK
jgi:photosystem II stability/assembly factor-like uncharacterized protein